MNLKTSRPTRLKILSDTEIDEELVSGEHDDATRLALLHEKTRRAVRDGSRPSALAWLTFFVALLGAMFAAIGAWPEIQSLVEKAEWLDF